MGWGAGGLIGQLLLRLLYRFVPGEAYESTVAALHVVDACGRARVLLDVGGGSGGLGRALGEVGCLLPYYLVVELDPHLARMALRSASSDAVVASACHLPIRPTPFLVSVFNDSLHHMEDPVGALREASRVDSRCIVVTDFDSSRRATLLLRIAERLLGFPAKFLEEERVEEVLGSEGYTVLYRVRGRFSSYTIAACRRRHEVD